MIRRLSLVTAFALTASACAHLAPSTSERPTTTVAEETDDPHTPYEREASPYFDEIRPVDDLVLHPFGEECAFEAGAATTLATTNVLRLHIADCHIVEAEPRAAQMSSDADCREWNRQTFDGRRQRVLRVPSGRTRIFVYNRGARAETGFWMRRESTDGETIVATGGIGHDSPQVLDLTLEPGEYVYSSPVNPTPDYTLIVEP